jgi:hypothetical protein
LSDPAAKPTDTSANDLYDDIVSLFGEALGLAFEAAERNSDPQGDT